MANRMQMAKLIKKIWKKFLDRLRSGNSINTKIVDLIEKFNNLLKQSKRKDYNIRLRAYKNMLKILEQVYNKIDIRAIEENDNIQNFNYAQKCLIYFHWIKKYQQNIDMAIKNLNDMCNNLDKFVIKNSQIIAMTTPAAASNHEILKNIGPRIVIVEEAAHVLEAHILSSLSQDCEHLILIGDHNQLKLRATVDSINNIKQINVSLIERLSIQRPEIRELVKAIYYFKIRDDHLLESRVKVNAVDNYQGEENDIILFSLVRSNDKHKIGSLLIKNRLCVAISRAKYGFFAIGNFESIKKNRQCKEINIILIQ